MSVKYNSSRARIRLTSKFFTQRVILKILILADTISHIVSKVDNAPQLTRSF